MPNAAAWRRRLPPTAPTISKCSGPASLNSVALGEASITALMSASAIGRVVDVDLADVDQMLDKAPQPEFFQIDARHGSCPAQIRCTVACGDPHQYQTRDPRYKQVPNTIVLP